jgi:hypothetical protein
VKKIKKWEKYHDNEVLKFLRRNAGNKGNHELENMLKMGKSIIFYENERRRIILQVQ